MKTIKKRWLLDYKWNHNTGIRRGRITSSKLSIRKIRWQTWSSGRRDRAMATTSYWCIHRIRFLIRQAKFLIIAKLYCTCITRVLYASTTSMFGNEASTIKRDVSSYTFCFGIFVKKQNWQGKMIKWSS